MKKQACRTPSQGGSRYFGLTILITKLLMSLHGQSNLSANFSRNLQQFIFCTSKSVNSFFLHCREIYKIAHRSSPSANQNKHLALKR